jgi:hypothetical protein
LTTCVHRGREARTPNEAAAPERSLPWQIKKVKKTQNKLDLRTKTEMTRRAEEKIMTMNNIDLDEEMMVSQAANPETMVSQAPTPETPLGPTILPNLLGTSLQIPTEFAGK